MNILIVILFFSFIVPSGIFSNGYERSINYSYDLVSDNDSYDIYNESLNIYENIQLKPKLHSATFNLVLKGRYEIGYRYNYNTSFINDYRLPYRGGYNSLYFYYHFKERKKFPLNLLFKIEYTESSEFRHNGNYVYNLRSTGLGFYKEIKLELNPFILLFEYDNISAYRSNLFIEKNTQMTLSIFFKIIVNNEDNSTMRDIIWLGPTLRVMEGDQFPGFSLGLYHPIK